MKTQLSSEKQRMLDVLDARWSVGEAAKNGTAFKLKIASLAAVGALTIAMTVPMGAVAHAEDIDSSSDAGVVVQLEDGDATVVSSGTSEVDADKTETYDADSKGVDWSDPSERLTQSDSVTTEPAETGEHPSWYIEPDASPYDPQCASTKKYEYMYEPPVRENNWVGTLHVVYTIGKDAEGDQIIDLDPKQIIFDYLTAEVSNFLKSYPQYSENSFSWSGDRYGTLGGYYNPETGLVDKGGITQVMPGDRYKFDVTIRSESGHTYTYKDGSFRLSTEAIAAAGEGSLVAFDGQNISGTSYDFDSSTAMYDTFYQKIQGFVYGDSEYVDDYAKSSKWYTDGYRVSVGDYMDSTFADSGPWAQANEYFKNLLASGLTADEASWVAFNAMTNFDIVIMNNPYMKTTWGYANSITLDQIDGNLTIVKYDDAGNVIGDDEDEDNASFYLWYVDDQGTEDSSDDVTMYYTMIPGEAGSDPVYGFVAYDPDAKLTWTIDASKGKIEINNTLLETIVYYLQEAVAPEGYVRDANIYIICSEEQLEELKNGNGDVVVSNIASGEEGISAVWVGTGIDSDNPLTIKFSNSVIPDPEPEPTPDPDPEPEPTPNPDPEPREGNKGSVASVIPETGDANAPLGAGIVAMASGALLLASRRLRGKSTPKHARF